MKRQQNKVRAALYELNVFQLAILWLFVPNVCKAYREKCEQCRILVCKNDRLERSNAQFRANRIGEWWK